MSQLFNGIRGLMGEADSGWRNAIRPGSISGGRINKGRTPASFGMPGMGQDDVDDSVEDIFGSRFFGQGKFGTSDFKDWMMPEGKGDSFLSFGAPKAPGKKGDKLWRGLKDIF